MTERERREQQWLDFLAEAPTGLAQPPPAPVTQSVLALISACPHRGPVLPHHLQPEGCGCKELTECRAQKGRAERPGAVTLAECVSCVGRSD